MKHRTGEQTVWAWVVLAALIVGAWHGVPHYIATLEGGIVFADPDCMQVTVDRVVEAGLTLEERVDSTRLWTVACLEERQTAVRRRADLVGWSANAAIGLAGVIALVVTGGWIAAVSSRRKPEGDA